MRHKNQKGFTLVETLIVLMIATLILPISLKEYAMVSERQQLNAFIGRLQELINFAQMTAMTEERYIVMDFNNGTHQVNVILGVNNLKSLKADESMLFQRGTLSLTFRFSPKGSLVGPAGTLFIKTAHYSEKIVFLLGQGRFYVQAA